MSKAEYQRDLIDTSPQVDRKMEPDSIYRILYIVGPSLLRDEDFVEMCADRNRCPSDPPSCVVRFLLLPLHEVDVSDRDVSERLQFDFRWQHAPRLPTDYPGIPHSSLSHFRSRLIVDASEGQVFHHLISVAG